jgi:hypothetical protein
MPSSPGWPPGRRRAVAAAPDARGGEADGSGDRQWRGGWPAGSCRGGWRAGDAPAVVQQGLQAGAQVGEAQPSGLLVEVAVAAIVDPEAPVEDQAARQRGWWGAITVPPAARAGPCAWATPSGYAGRNRSRRRGAAGDDERLVWAEEGAYRHGGSARWSSSKKRDSLVPATMIRGEALRIPSGCRPALPRPACSAAAARPSRPAQGVSVPGPKADCAHPPLVGRTCRSAVDGASVVGRMRLCYQAAPTTRSTTRPRAAALYSRPGTLVTWWGDMVAPGKSQQRLGFATMLWALIPVLSFGLLSFLPFAHAAVKLPNRRMWLLPATYAVVEVVGARAPWRSIQHG